MAKKTVIGQAKINAALEWRAALKGISQTECATEDLRFFWALLALEMDSVYAALAKTEARILLLIAREQDWDLSYLPAWLQDCFVPVGLPYRFEYLVEKIRGLPVFTQAALLDWLSIVKNAPGTLEKRELKRFHGRAGL